MQETEIRRGTKAARQEAFSYEKYEGFKGVYWDGGMDTIWDHPDLLEHYLDWFDCCKDCYWWEALDDEQVMPEDTVDYGALVDVALEKRAKGMKRSLDEAGWIEVDGEDEWSDGEDVHSVMGFSDWEDA
jgi:hypothetical protein